MKRLIRNVGPTDVQILEIKSDVQILEIKSDVFRCPHNVSN